MNLRAAGDWDRYSNHRRHLTDLALAQASGGDICFFGAGNAGDLDLERLASQFRSIHLVDIDAEALQRARLQLPSNQQDKLRLHALDLTGCIDRIDAWSTDTPQDLAAFTMQAARNVVSQLGQAFDVSVSNCVLSQLVTPFERMWARSAPEWSRLEAALTVGHLLTLGGSLRPGGTGVLALDVLSSSRCPEVAQLADVPASELEDALAELDGVEETAWICRPPDILEALEAVPPLVALVQAPDLSAPWLWDLGDAIQLVYAVVFKRRAEPSVAAV